LSSKQNERKKKKLFTLFRTKVQILFVSILRLKFKELGRKSINEETPF
jgi:hypothetical protein